MGVKGKRVARTLRVSRVFYVLDSRMKRTNGGDEEAGKGRRNDAPGVGILCPCIVRVYDFPGGSEPRKLVAEYVPGTLNVPSPDKYTQATI